MSQENNISALSPDQKAALRASLANEARKLLGIPYKFGFEWTDYSKTPDFMDCSEMVEGVYKITGLNMPDGSQNQFDFTEPATAPTVGDLAFFGRGGKPTQIYHVGMILDEFNMIEARAFDPSALFETGKVILRSRLKWEKFPNFCGYRAHKKLA